MLLLTKIT